MRHTNYRKACEAIRRLTSIGLGAYYKRVRDKIPVSIFPTFLNWKYFKSVKPICWININNARVEALFR